MKISTSIEKDWDKKTGMNTVTVAGIANLVYVLSSFSTDFKECCTEAGSKHLPTFSGHNPLFHQITLVSQHQYWIMRHWLRAVLNMYDKVYTKKNTLFNKKSLPSAKCLPIFEPFEKTSHH